ncbi:MAG: clostripain-related cysteine peptidase [Eubacteriales bacterium]|nr:clostripain-related cysteine peptidase [Eubacteriales bacterium]
MNENKDLNMETDNVNVNEAEEKKPSKWKLWRIKEKERKEAEKAYYNDAPFLVRAWHFVIKKLIIAVVVIAVLIGLGFSAFYSFMNSGAATGIALEYIDSVKSKPISAERIRELTTSDEEGAAKIDAMAPNGANETWGIYVYMVGADLEDQNQNDLSDTTRYLVQDLKAENRALKVSQYSDNFGAFYEELEKNGLDLPEYLFNPVVPVAKSVPVTEDVVVAQGTGAATSDIYEMTAGTWNENIEIVIQTGGATHWTHPLVNPNKTQRFLYKNGAFREIENLSLRAACSPYTLADFLAYCNENYPADHKVVILWNHGSGAAGYGHESLTGGGFTLDDLEYAFALAVDENVENPPYEIIGFDACLMATAETAVRLDGYGKYLVASEELEPGDGWDYTTWLQKLSDNPSMNSAQLGKAIVDSFIDYYATYSENIGKLVGEQDVTLSLVDMHKAAETFEAYNELCRAQLKDAAGNLGVLADIGYLAGKTTRYGLYVYDRVNQFDLGDYMDFVWEYYPDEARKVKSLLKEAVLYHRESNSLKDSNGLSVYIPVETKKLGALLGALDYVYQIEDGTDVAALYYYKMAGCVNEDYKAYVTSLAGVEPKVLQVSLLKDFQKISPKIEDGFWSIAVSEELSEHVQDIDVAIGHYDRQSDIITYYGVDDYAVFDGYGNIVNEFDGQWIAIDGVILATEIVNSNDSIVSYRSKVKCDGEQYYLMFTFDRDTEEFTINGLKKFLTDEQEYIMLNTRQLDTVLGDKTIKPVYNAQDLRKGNTCEVEGKSVKIKDNTKIDMIALPDGDYLNMIEITDQRGDVYFSQVVEQTVKGGKLSAQELSVEFVGKDY